MVSVSELPRSLRVLVRLGAGYLAVIAVGLTSTVAHYTWSPTFEEFAAERPVSNEVIEARIPPGRSFPVEGDLVLGTVDPRALDPDSDLELRKIPFEYTVEHAGDPLVSLEFDTVAALDPETFDRAGLVFEKPRVRTAEGFRTIVIVGLWHLEALVGPGSVGRGAVVLDVLLVAGAGEDEVRFQEVDMPGLPFAQTGSRLPWWTGVPFGFFFPLGGLPEEGFVQHFRAVQYLSWRRTANGESGVGLGLPQLECSTGSYSITTRLGRSSSGAFGAEPSVRQEWRNRVRWMGEDR